MTHSLLLCFFGEKGDCFLRHFLYGDFVKAEYGSAKRIVDSAAPVFGNVASAERNAENGACRCRVAVSVKALAYGETDGLAVIFFAVKQRSRNYDCI